MAPKLPATLFRRPSCTPLTTPSPITHTQTRNATFVLRHRRPYQFTQLVQLSDGSTFTVRTSSPASLYKSAKDSRNHVLWQPSDKSLRNLEVDEAGKLAAFRERFGRGWDMADGAAAEEVAPAPATPAEAGKKETTDAAAKADAAKADAAKAEADAAEPAVDPFESLVDLISGYATAEDKNTKGGLSAKDQARKDKAKKK